MQKFLDLITSLFPNWIKSRKLMFEFQAEWKSIESGGKDERKKVSYNVSNGSNLSGLRKSVGKSLISSLDFSKLESGQSFINTKRPQRKTKKSHFNRTQSIDIENSMYSFKEVSLSSPTALSPVLRDSIERYKSSLKDKFNLRHFIEDLQSHKAGNIRNTSATKFPKLSLKKQIPALTDPDPPMNFDKELTQYRRSLLQKEFNKFKNTEPSSLHMEFDKMHERLASLKLSLQAF